jgi:hypothetical protein
MECGPAARVEVVKVATPEASGRVSKAAAPSKMVTVPVGVAALEVTVAVNVTLAPMPAEIGSTETLVVVEAKFTTSEVCAVAAK